MVLTADLITVVLGLCVGFLGGLIGDSGSIFILLGLLTLGIAPDYKTAAGTTLAVFMVPIYLLAVIEYYKRGQVMVKQSIILLVTMIFAAWLGSMTSVYFTNSQLQFIGGIMFFMTSLFFFWNSYTGKFGKK